MYSSKKWLSSTNFPWSILEYLKPNITQKNVTKRSYFILESSASISPNEGNDHNRSDFEEHPLIILPYFAAKKSK